jgi:hypothetical protein
MSGSQWGGYDLLRSVHIPVDHSRCCRRACGIRLQGRDGGRSHEPWIGWLAGLERLKAHWLMRPNIKREAEDVEEGTHGVADAPCSFAEGARMQEASSGVHIHQPAPESCAYEQRYLDSKGLSADNERPTYLGTVSRRSSTGKSASRKRSHKESQGGAAIKPRQKTADKTEDSSGSTGGGCTYTTAAKAPSSIELLCTA